MKILGIDTSSNTCSVAISCRDNILASNYSKEPAMQVENLLPMIQRTMIQAQVTFKGIDYLAITQGPGSFTGIRIGLAAALGITISSTIIPIVVSNFAVLKFLACQQVKGVEVIFIIINAYKDKLYLQKFDLKENVPSLPQLLSIVEVVNIISKTQSLLACAGSGVKIICKFLTEIPQNHIYLPRFAVHDARPICKLAYQLLSQQKQTIAARQEDKVKNRNTYIKTLVPLYIKLPNVK